MHTLPSLPSTCPGWDLHQPSLGTRCWGPGLSPVLWPPSWPPGTLPATPLFVGTEQSCAAPSWPLSPAGRHCGARGTVTSAPLLGQDSASAAQGLPSVTPTQGTASPARAPLCPGVPCSQEDCARAGPSLVWPQHDQGTQSKLATNPPLLLPPRGGTATNPCQPFLPHSHHPTLAFPSPRPSVHVSVPGRWCPWRREEDEGCAGPGAGRG